MKAGRAWRTLCGVSALAVGIHVPGPADAQEQQAQPEEHSADSGNHAQFGPAEVIVTARKRAERLQDVPLSAEVIGGEQLQAKAQTTLAELTARVPAVRISEGGMGNRLSMRGIGSGENNPLFEQSVGTFIDGVYHGRSRSTDAQFLDLDSIEVLKGPQSTYFGNNAIAGALNIHTKNPGRGPDGFLRGLYNASFNNYTFEGAYGGAITDSLLARAAALYSGGDGWLKDDFSGTHVPENRRTVGRVTAMWVPTSELTMTIKGQVERGRNNGGLALQLVDCPPPPAFAAGPAAFCRSALANGVNTDLNDNHRSLTPGQGIDVDSHEVSGTATYDIGGHTLSSITAYYDLDYALRLDLDGSPAQLFSSTLPEHFHQFSQELRLTSPTDGPVEYLVGGYYQRDHIDGQAIFTYSFLAPIITASPTLRPLAAYPPFSQSDHYLQTTDTLAAFAALTWKVTDELRIVAGIRSSRVKKDFEQTTFFGSTPGAFGEVAPFPSPSLNALAAGFAARLRLGAAGTRILSRTDRHTSPSFTVQYSPTGSMMIYGSYVNGFKSGGFNATEHSGQPNTLTFDPEKVDAFEIGAKTQWFDRRLTLDLALFYNKYHGLQASVSQNQTGAILAVVRNVGGAISKGAEMEAHWAFDSNWTAGLSLSLLDSYYSSYPNAGAPPILVARGQPIVDLTGHKTRYAPDYSGNLVVDYLKNLGDYRLGVNGNLFLSGKYNYSNNDDPLLVQGAYAELDLSLTLGRPTAGWELSVIGRNLTDRTVVTFGTAVPSTPGSYYMEKEPPRSTSLQLRYKF